MEYTFSINAIELASELADEKLRNELSNYLQLDINTNTYTYTDEAQDLFNQYYDEYLTIIEGVSERSGIPIFSKTIKK